MSISEYHTNRTQNQAIRAPHATMSITMTPGPVIGSLCTGYGGLNLGVLAALGGGRIAWCADPDPHIATILTTRMPDVPNLGDLRTVDRTPGRAHRGTHRRVPVSGHLRRRPTRAGIEKGERSGLWTEIVAALLLLRPTLLIVENVAALRWRHGGLHRVLGDLAEAGYDAIWRNVRPADIGAAHRRERLFLLGWPQLTTGHRDAADPDRSRRKLQRAQRSHQTGRPHPARASAPPSDTHASRLQLGCDPDRAHSQTSRLPDADQVGGAAATHPDHVGREGPHAANPAPWTFAARRSPVAAHAGSLGHGDGGSSGRDGAPADISITDACHCGPRGAVADTASDRRHEGRSRATGLQGRPHAALGDHSPALPTGHGRHLPVVEDHEDGSATAGRRECGVDWGIYAAAVTRWEQVLGRRAPCPTQLGRHGRPVLSPAFVEHLMGLPRGWVTDLPLPRTAQLRALGNGVVPQQAAYGVSLLLADLATPTAAERHDFGQELNAA